MQPRVRRGRQPKNFIEILLKIVEVILYKRSIKEVLLLDILSSSISSDGSQVSDDSDVVMIPPPNLPK